MSFFLDGKANHKPTTDISKRDESFLKEFSRDFHQKILDTDDSIDLFENILSEWINNLDKETIFELMKNHKEKVFWFSSMIGFFYQCGIGCDVDKNKALEFYLLAVNNN